MEAPAPPPGFGPILFKSDGRAGTMGTPSYPPGFDSIPSKSGDGADIMEIPAPPPGFGPIPSANTGGLEGAVQMRSFKAAYCGPKCRSAHHHADVEASFCFYMSIKEQSVVFGAFCLLLVFC